jgi:NAD+ kinase
MNVGIVARKGNDEAVATALDVYEVARDRGETVWVDEETASSLTSAADAPTVTGRPVEALDACDLAVAIGGDGTFLFVARNAGETPVLGVNLGEVGFLNAVPPASATAAVRSALDGLANGDLSVREAPRLVARADEWESVQAANEIVVHGDRRGPGSGIEYELTVDDSPYSTGRADGVLVATPTGSTAYNLSERGPLVAPDVDGLVVNEMAARTGMPPIVVDADATVGVTVRDPGGVTVVADGRDATQVSGPVTVRVERAYPPMRIAGPEGDFYEALTKLS